MPITKVEFHTAVEQGVDDFMNRVHAFLAADKDTAYSELELKRQLGAGDDRAAQAAFREALRSLEGLDAIRWGIVGDTDYYIYHSELRLPRTRR